MLSSADLARLLERTSRTFALAIPLLEAPLAHQVGVAYLLFRIADTLEDATLWPRDTRLEALTSFVSWLDGAREGAKREAHWQHLVRERAPVREEGYLELLARADDVLAEGAAFTPILHHVRRTAEGMASFVARQDERGAIALADVDDLRRYCYVVAGIVGEMLTELFVAADEHARVVASDLRADAAAFGEALQLVNILKDATSDARDGRAYLPPSAPRSEITALARADLVAARRYVSALERAGASRGTVAFCDLPVRLAEATLDRLDAGAPKLGRDDALAIYAAVRTRAER